jgi:hypothetical protein
VTAGPAWWTAADAAELDVLVFELVEAAWPHRECARCRELGTWCPPMVEAAETVLTWRRGRNLLSRAEFLRGLEASA